MSLRPLAKVFGDAGTETRGGGISADVDDVLQMLGNARRRRVIERVLDAGQVQLSDLATKMAAIEEGSDPEELSETQYKRVYVALYQCHLPQLDGVGAINYDDENGWVSTTAETAAWAELWREIDTHIGGEDA